jgi:hypothetical protein
MTPIVSTIISGGGEDIRIGIYESLEDDIADASECTVDVMASECLMSLTPQTQAPEPGAG